jgi:hypothetical protein
MKAVFTLTPAESRRLIARAVAQMPEVQAALKNAYVIITGGTTNAFVAQEILGTREVDPGRFTAGTSAYGTLCVTDPKDRQPFPIILFRGDRVDKTIREALDDFRPETIVIKGANAVDPEGNVGIITSGYDGGTVAATIGTMTHTGLNYIVPVGLEKLVPSVKESSIYTGAKTYDYSMGADFGMYCLVKAKAVTEIKALEILAGVETKLVAAGGIAGNQGAVVLVSMGEKENLEKAIEAVEAVKGEPEVTGVKGDCKVCRYTCVFHGKSEEELPQWLHG